MTTLSKKSVLLTNDQPDQVDQVLEALVSEAQALFKVLDSTSSKIRDLEKKLGEIKAHFPFSYFVSKEESHDPQTTDAVDVHKQSVGPFTYVGYNSYVKSYLAWEADDNSKNFRLFLISRKQEFTVADVEGDIQESRSPTIDQVVYKKALIETDLPTRLKFAEHLQLFMKKFKEHLHLYRTSIEGQQLDSFDDELPF